MAQSVNIEMLKKHFKDGIDSITFEFGGLHFFCTIDKEVLTQTINEGYERAAVIEAKPVKKKEVKEESDE